MKTILIAILALAWAPLVPAGERFPAATAKNIQTYDVPTLHSQLTAQLNRVVAVRFHYRSAKLRHLKPRWYQASIWQHNPAGTKGYSGLRVMVDKKDVAAFETFTANEQSTTEATLYARVEKDPDNNLAHLRALGRTMTTDDAGNVTFDW